MFSIDVINNARNGIIHLWLFHIIIFSSFLREYRGVTIQFMNSNRIEENDFHSTHWIGYSLGIVL